VVTDADIWEPGGGMGGQVGDDRTGELSGERGDVDVVIGSEPEDGALGNGRGSGRRRDRGR